jgi:predicted transcriptional regulator of viral defense system
VGELAARQHGVVAASQLYGIGLSRAAVSRWSRAGRLVRLYPGVYAFGHAILALNGRRMAWVLAAGPDAMLSDRTAGAFHGVFVDHGTRVHVTTPRAGARGLAAFVVHQRRLDPHDRTELEGIPVTTLERTLIDIAATEHPGRLTKAFERAEELSLLDLDRIRTACDRNRGQRGVGRVRALLDIYEPRDPRLIRSRLERGMLKLLETNRFPPPLVNLNLHGWEADLHWPERSLVVELDGWQGHRTREAFERDHRRDPDLEARGYRVLRVSYEQFRTDKPAILRALAA